MAACCGSQTLVERPDATLGACPECRTKGEPVDSLTVKALLTETALGRFERGEYRFCADADCSIVYFHGSAHAFRTADIRVPVWQKAPLGARTVCYCFGENEADIVSEIERAGESRAVSRVRAHIAAGRCVCEVRNPRGVCCLGELTAAVNRIAPRAKSHA